MKQFLQQTLATLLVLLAGSPTVWADDFTVERAVNLSQLDSWADMSRFQWQAIDHVIQDNRQEMDALKALFYDPAPKDTVGFYNQIYQARDNQYIVLRLDKAQGKRPFHIRVTGIKSATDPSQNTSRLFASNDYVYIMPPIGETQLEVKIWPQGEGEEKAKSYIFYSHSYGSASVRTVMLDKSRIVPGDYDLQLIRYNKETEKSDTSYIEKMVTDKLYSFYDYVDGDLVEAYIRTPSTNGYKRIKLNHDMWAQDAVTHINDNSVTVRTDPKMPFQQHKRLDAPNPTYIDTRLFSHHDTLWVSLYLNNIPSFEAEGLTMHAVLADFDNNPIGEKLLKWDKDPVSGRLYVLTDGEPCTIECYRDGYLPKLLLYPGSYDHVTGIIEGDREEADIYLEPIDAPVTSPKVSSAVLSTLTPTTDLRGGKYICDIQESDILPTPLTETVFYDEYASHKDTAKIARGMEYNDNYAEMEVAIVAPYSYGTSGNITMKKVHNAEENAIRTESLDGDTRGIYHHLFDYTYWTSKFDLRNYLDTCKAGRPGVAFDNVIVRHLPILCNYYTNLWEVQKSAEESLKENLGDNDASGNASGWVSDIAPSAASGLELRIPLAPPFYVRFGVDMDFFKAKKIGVYLAAGAGIEYDVIDKKSNYKPKNEQQSFSVNMISDVGEFGPGYVGDVTPTIAALGKEPDNFKYNPNDPGTGAFTVGAFVEQYSRFSIPLTRGEKKWKQWLSGMQFIDEVSLRAEAHASIGYKMDLLNMISSAGTLAGSDKLASFQNWLLDNPVAAGLKSLIGPGLSAGITARLNVTTGIFSFQNTLEDGWTDPLKNHILAFRFLGQVAVNASLKAKLDAFVAGAEAGLSTGAGVSFKYSAGNRLDFKYPFSGSAWSWYAGVSAYYKIKFLCWSKKGSWDVGRLTVQQKLIEPKNYRNPFDRGFARYLSGEPETPEGGKQQTSLRAKASLPGEFVTKLVDFSQPVKFIAGGDSIVYQGAYESPNDYCVEVASTGDPIYLSDFRLGGCTDYDAVSIPGTDLVVLEQATGQIAKEDLEDTLQLDETMKRASRVYSVYYTKKHTGTKWYSPQPVYSSQETTSYLPRVALADNGTGVAIWQEGLFEKGSWVTDKDTVQLTDMVMNGQLMLSRFDGNETWTAPIPLLSLDENMRLKDYRITYDGTTAFIIARKVGREGGAENLCMTVDAGGQVATHDIEQTDELLRLRRVGNQNIVAWTELADTTTTTTAVQVKSYGMDGKAQKGINISLMLNNVQVEDFRVVPDLQAQSLRNVALLWRETKSVNDSAMVRLMTARLVPNEDGSFGIGTPIAAVSLDHGNAIYGFDGYMTDEKMQVCYVAVDSTGYSQLNKTAAYFGNAFGYSIAFDKDNNQGFQCGKDEISVLVTVNNYGTSTINECVLTVTQDDTDQDFPLNMTIPAGESAKERVVIPYHNDAGVNTTMRVKYDDVLGTQQQSYARYLARRAKRAGKYAAGGTRRADDAAAKEDAVYEQHTATFYPHRPRTECFVVAQRVDKNGDNYITICVRDYSRRKFNGNFAYIVGLKESPYSSIVYNTKENNHIKYETKKLFFNAANMEEGGRLMLDCGSYRVGYVTLKVSGVTEKEQMYAGATLALKIPFNDDYLRLAPVFSGSNNSGVVTLYPSSETVAVEKVFTNGDSEARMHVSRQGGSLVVTGVEAGQQVRLYEATGAILGRKVADQSGKAVFTVPAVSGVGLVSSGKETVKFVY